MRLVRRELALLLVVPALWGSAFVAIRAGVTAGAAPFAFAGYRYAIAAALVAAFALAGRRPLPPRRELLQSALVAGGLMMGVYAALVYWGEQTTSGGLASVLVSTAPIWTALVALPLLPTERVGRAGAAGVGVGFVGVLLLFVPGGAGPDGGFAGLLAPLGAAAVAAVGSVLLRRSGFHFSGVWNLGAGFGVAAGILLVLAAVTPDGFAVPPSAVVVSTLLYLAIGSSVFGYGLYFVLLQRVGPARANVVAYLNPVVGVTVGVIALRESVSPYEIGGVALILLAVGLLHYRPHPPGATSDRDRPQPP